jgi:hypothetical protein
MVPQSVMHYKGPVIDPSTIEIKVPTLQPIGGATPAPGGLPGLPGQPALGIPDLGGGTTPAPGAAPAPGTLPTLPGQPSLGAPVVTP